MSHRKLLIDINCEDTTCHSCCELEDEICQIFDVYIGPTWNRCYSCLEAEKEAKQK